MFAYVLVEYLVHFENDLYVYILLSANKTVLTTSCFSVFYSIVPPSVNIFQ